MKNFISHVRTFINKLTYYAKAAYYDSVRVYRWLDKLSHKKRQRLTIICMAVVVSMLLIGIGAAVSIHTTDVANQRLNRLQELHTELLKSQKAKTDTDTQLKAKESHEADLKRQIDDLNKQLQAKKEAQLAAQAAIQQAPAPLPYYAPIVGCVDPASTMAAAGISPSDYSYVDYIVSHEGSWCGTTRYNTGGSGAYGLCQALPGGKMASAGADWATNPVTQLRWCSAYAGGKGGWYASYLFWVANHWW